MMNRIDRIKEMEKIYDKTSKSVKELEKALEAFKKDEKALYKLSKYYGSKAWLDDYDAYDAGKVPKNVKAGVLSQDLVYDLLVDYHDLVTEMSKLVNKALEEQIWVL